MFARKLVRPGGAATLEDTHNEVRAVAKLCVLGANPNVVAVLRHGRLVNSSSYHLDMELCDYNLETYMNGKWMSMSGLDRLTQGGKIVTDIANGLAFIHGNNEIHPDIKPRNSTLLHAKLAEWSHVFFSGRFMEDCRFRTHS